MTWCGRDGAVKMSESKRGKLSEYRRIARCVFVYVYTKTDNELDPGERVYSADAARCLHETAPRHPPLFTDAEGPPYPQT